MKLADLISVIVYDYLWGLPLVVLILGTGVYITVRTGFFQFRCFGMSMKHAFNSIFHREKKDENDTGVLSPLEAMSTALGTTIGVGNIGGVASAIAVGGPGAVFWMWVAGLFGMIIKMAEITLAVHYRSKDANNEAYGGPNYYMKKGLGIEKKWKGVFKVLSFIFAFGFLIGYFINIQTYTVSEAVANTFNIDMMVVGIVYTIALYVMISGGLKSVGKFAMTMVPFMCIFYITCKRCYYFFILIYNNIYYKCKFSCFCCIYHISVYWIVCKYSCSSIFAIYKFTTVVIHYSFC